MPSKKPSVTIPRELHDDIVHALTQALEQPFECSCDAYQEWDTGAWAHDEERCWAFMEDHIDITLTELEKLGEVASGNAWRRLLCGSQPGFFPLTPLNILRISLMASRVH